MDPSLSKLVLRLHEVVGEGYILVGDAACFVDPLFSSGVHLALMAGVLAAAYVTTALKDPSMGAHAGRVYKDLYYKEYNHFHDLAALFYSSNRTTDSYFWEARRLLGHGHLSPRQAFLHAVAGQPPRSYERVVLEQGEAPAEFVHSVRSMEAERVARRAQLATILNQTDIQRTTLYRLLPRLDSGVKVERQPILAEGEFVWGYVLRTAGYPEGIPCSGLVARLASLIDGNTSVGALVAKLWGERQLNARDRAPCPGSLAVTLRRRHHWRIAGVVTEEPWVHDIGPGREYRVQSRGRTRWDRPVVWLIGRRTHDAHAEPSGRGMPLPL